MTENTPKIDPALATPDAVFAMLATAQHKSEAVNAASDDQFDEAIDDEWVTLDNIVASRPTTAAGVATVLRFFAARMDRDSFCQTELLETLLGNMATALDPIEAGRLS